MSARGDERAVLGVLVTHATADGTAAIAAVISLSTPPPLHHPLHHHGRPLQRSVTFWAVLFLQHLLRAMQRGHRSRRREDDGVSRVVLREREEAEEAEVGGIRRVACL